MFQSIRAQLYSAIYHKWGINYLQKASTVLKFRPLIEEFDWLFGWPKTNFITIAPFQKQLEHKGLPFLCWRKYLVVMIVFRLKEWFKDCSKILQGKTNCVLLFISLCCVVSAVTWTCCCLLSLKMFSGLMPHKLRISRLATPRRHSLTISFGKSVHLLSVDVTGLSP